MKTEGEEGDVQQGEKRQSDATMNQKMRTDSRSWKGKEMDTPLGNGSRAVVTP